MKSSKLQPWFKAFVHLSVVFTILAVLAGFPHRFGYAVDSSTAPVPLVEKGHPVAWWFVFKFNSKTFPGCGGGATRACLFGGEPQDYKWFGQQYVYASSETASLREGNGCAGDTAADPIGATFDQVYNNSFHYVVWNDQFYDDPAIKGCTKECGAPWGHSKGMLAWNEAGEGFVMQVTTPSWPAAGSKRFPRKTDGNTLGCVVDDNVEVSQHFFALRLTKDDLVKVLRALQNASVVTDPTNPQVVDNGGPADVQELVQTLGIKSKSLAYTKVQLSSGVELISKPSRLNVPPWQMVSAVLGGVSLRAATWWANPKIYTTTSSSDITCWDDSLGKPGPVEIATTGSWSGKEFGLTGGLGPNFNHAKVGVSIAGNDHYSVFGDMNQQGSISGQKCSSSQNGRGGLFYVIDNAELHDSLKNLLNGGTAPADPSGNQQAGDAQLATAERTTVAETLNVMEAGSCVTPSQASGAGGNAAEPTVAPCVRIKTNDGEFQVNTSPQAEFDKPVTVVLSGLNAWAKDKAQNDPEKLRLFLAGRMIPGVVPTLIDLSQDYINFSLKLYPADRDLWVEILTQARSQPKHQVPISVGLMDTKQPFASHLYVRFVVYPSYWPLVITFLLALFAGLVIMGSKYDLLRDSVGRAPEAPAKRPFSLGRVQMACWFYLVIASYIYIWLLTGEANALTGSVLTLIGISAGTGLAAAFVDTDKANTLANQRGKLESNKTALEMRIKEIQAASPKEDSSLYKELQEKQSSLANTKAEIANLRAVPAPAVSRGFVRDILGAGQDMSFHRFQMAVWTIVLAMIFVRAVHRDLAMPEFDPALLGLMGISSGTYLGFKYPEKPKP